MSTISAQDVKQLREKTGAGMMDCKKALTENNGDFEAATDWLRKKGLSAAAKKAGRTAAEGLVAMAVSGTEGVLVEINAETDFVARNEKFQAFADALAQLALSQKADSAEILSVMPYPSTGRNVTEELANLIATIGEHMSLRRTVRVSVPQGCVAAYMHNNVTPNLGKIGVLVGLESTGNTDALLALGKKLAMHVAAAAPLALNTDGIDQDIIDREKAIFMEQAKNSGKPDAVIEKMAEGRLRKFFEESALLEQPFVMDPAQKIRDVVISSAKEQGTAIALTSFARFQLGEGIEKEQKDFAAEVQAQLAS
jgi:elongation factor Ts